MAMDSDMLLNTILAWSATHLALRDKNYQIFSLETRNTALRSFSQSLSSSTRKAEIELACCLMHCAMESIVGDTMQWARHLLGAFLIIRSVCQVENTERLDLSRFSRTAEGRWLLSSFAYHDVLRAVADDTRPWIDSGHYFLNNSHPDSYFGLATQIMYLLSRVCVLNADMAEFGTFSNEQRARLYDRSSRLESRLLNWKCSPSDNQALVHLAEMYRSATLIYLYRNFRRHQFILAPMVMVKALPYITDIVDRLALLPKGSLVECSLLFPMFVAAGEATDLEQIDIIRERMEYIARERHFYNIRACLEVLDELWWLRAEGLTGQNDTKLDWRHILSRRKWILSIT